MSLIHLTDFLLLPHRTQHFLLGCYISRIVREVHSNHFHNDLGACRDKSEYVDNKLHHIVNNIDLSTNQF